MPKLSAIILALPMKRENLLSFFLEKFAQQGSAIFGEYPAFYFYAVIQFLIINNIKDRTAGSGLDIFGSEINIFNPRQH